MEAFRQNRDQQLISMSNLVPQQSLLLHCITAHDCKLRIVDRSLGPKHSVLTCFRLGFELLVVHCEILRSERRGMIRTLYLTIRMHCHRGSSIEATEGTIGILRQTSQPTTYASFSRFATRAAFPATANTLRMQLILTCAGIQSCSTRVFCWRPWRGTKQSQG